MIEILQETKTSVVCVKPVGIAAQGTDPQALPQLLAAQLGCEVYPVHRLDQTVGGVMVFARSRMADSLLSRQVQAHTFEKDYLAVLEGVPAQASGVLEDQLRRDTAARRTCVADAPGPDTRPARLSYRVLGEEDGRALVLIRLETGRTHQIRAQFSSRGLPLCGDAKYGAAAPGPLGLWSYRIAFCHPQTGRPLQFSHLPPAEDPWLPFQTALSQLEGGPHGQNERT